jgi:murein DD-endopeptidase MepM/ murein hydrolase activator NlpD
VTTTAVNSAAPQPTLQTDQQKAAKQLEAFFLRRLLTEARPQGGMLDGGFAGDTFKQMLDEAIADKMSSAGGIGMSAMFEKQLGGEATKASVAQVGSAMPMHAETPRALPMPKTEVPHLPPVESTSGFAMPAVGRLSSAYGKRIDPINHTESLHPGQDIAAKAGTPVVAAAAGTVTHAGPAGTYGNLVTITHANGLETRYAHLSSVDVQKGVVVNPGTPIGKVGSTGRSTGPHLHFEVREDGKLKDPAAYLPVESGPRPLNSSGK